MKKCDALPTIESQIISRLLFEKPPEDIEKLITSNNVDITKIIPSLGTSILHLIGQLPNDNAAILMESLIASRAFHVDNIDNRDSYGMTILHYAVQNECYIMMKLMVACEANPNIQNGYGNTPMHLAALNHNCAAVKTLLELETTDISIKNGESYTAKDIADFNGEVEISSLLAQEPSVKDDEIELFSKEDLQIELSKIPQDGKPEGSFEAILRDLSTSPSTLPIDVLDGSEITALESLKIKFPNFVDIIEFIINELSLMMISKSKFKSIRPILMHGAPGVGKTRFVTELSRILSLPLCRMDGGAVSSGFSIAGINPSYRNAKMGSIATFMTEVEYANGLVFIDEIDKLSDSEESNQFAPLHSLLVKETAKKFKDDFLNVPLNCSELNWIGTANILSKIPKSIQSRFQLFEIQPPTKSHMKAIVRSILSDIEDDESMSWSHAFDLELPEQVMEKLISLPVRDLRNIILGGLAKAARYGRPSNKVNKIILKPEYFTIKSDLKTKIGFVG